MILQANKTGKSIIFKTTIPQERVKELKWKKGTELYFQYASLLLDFIKPEERNEQLEAFLSNGLILASDRYQTLGKRKELLTDDEDLLKKFIMAFIELSSRELIPPDINKGLEFTETEEKRIKGLLS